MCVVRLVSNMMLRDTMEQSVDDRYEITDKVTGKKVDAEHLVTAYYQSRQTEQKRGFEISYPYQLMRFLRAADAPQVKVLVYLLDQKTGQNLINETSRSVSTQLNMSKTTVHKVMKNLQAARVLIKIQQGTYLLSPDVLVYGGNNAWRVRDMWNRQLALLEER